MSFCWKDYIDISEELINLAKNNPFEKAYLRTSISRAYYGIYCIARNYLRDNRKLKILTPNTHQFVIDSLKNSQNNNEQSIGIYLASLRDERNKADYEDNYFLDFNKAKLVLFSAMQVINFARSLGVNI